MHDQANDFARAILMPTEAFKKEIRGGNNTVLGLAKKFQASTIAIRIRAKELGFHGSGID